MNLTSGMDLTESGNPQPLSAVRCVSECIALEERAAAFIQT